MPQPKSKIGYRIGIVNPLTLVGNEIKTILRERSFPFEKVVLLDTTGKAAGALTELGDEPLVVTAASDDELEDLDLVFFCGPPAPNREWIDRYSEDRFIVTGMIEGLPDDASQAIDRYLDETFVAEKPRRRARKPVRR